MRSFATLALASVLAFPLAGCAEVGDVVSGAQDAYDGARESVESGLETLRWCTAAFRLGAAVTARDIEAARSAAQDLQANAPDELEADIALILDAIDAAERSDFGPLRSQEVQDAGRRVRETAEERCDPSTRPE